MGKRGGGVTKRGSNSSIDIKHLNSNLAKCKSQTQSLELDPSPAILPLLVLRIQGWDVIAVIYTVT